MSQPTVTNMKCCVFWGGRRRRVANFCCCCCYFLKKWAVQKVMVCVFISLKNNTSTNNTANWESSNVWQMGEWVDLAQDRGRGGCSARIQHLDQILSSMALHQPAYLGGAISEAPLSQPTTQHKVRGSDSNWVAHDSRDIYLK